MAQGPFPDNAGEILAVSRSCQPPKTSISWTDSVTVSIESKGGTRGSLLVRHRGSWLLAYQRSWGQWARWLVAHVEDQSFRQHYRRG
jgi:hypothetical protein